MVKYPSRVVEQTRESITSFKNPLEALLLLTCLAKNGMRTDRKRQLISECISHSDLTEDQIVELYTLLKEETIAGKHMNSDQKRLGCEPNGNYRHEEYLIAKAIEEIVDIRLYRSQDPRYDFDWYRYKCDLVGPVAPFYFDSDAFLHSLNNHFENKQGMDILVVCTLTLPVDDQVAIRRLIREDNRTESIELLIMDNEEFDKDENCISDLGFLFADRVEQIS